MTCHKCEPPKRADLCAKHLADERAKDKEEAVRRAMAGQCSWCADDAVPGRARCQKHLELARKITKDYESRKRVEAALVEAEAERLKKGREWPSAKEKP